jgi:hypothetical protein
MNPTINPKHLNSYSHTRDNIKMDLREIKWGDMDWIDFAQDKNQWKVLVNEPSGSIKC